MDHTAHVPPTTPVRADRILVVDADAIACQVIREALITAGYEVDEAILTGIAVLVAHRRARQSIERLSLPSPRPGTTQRRILRRAIRHPSHTQR